MSEPGDVLAVVLTFNAPDGAAACVNAIQAQTRPPDAILVVDNDSEVPVDEALLTALGPAPVVVARLEEDVGPAGGYAVGLERFASSATGMRGRWMTTYSPIRTRSGFSSTRCSVTMIERSSVPLSKT
jgi:hypothetical protein